MNVSMPVEVRRLVTQAAISTAARERRGVDDSAWVVRAVLEKLEREGRALGLGEAVSDAVRSLARGGAAAGRAARDAAGGHAGGRAA